jgi:hypothetical protein
MPAGLMVIYYLGVPARFICKRTKLVAIIVERTMPKIFVTIIFISCLGCSPKQTDKEILNADSFRKKRISPDTCSFCSIDPFLVESTEQDIQTNITIDFPVAIVLLDRVGLVHKYERENYDTLMKLFKMKHQGDRSEIYRLYDVYGYYTEGVKPLLILNEVTIIDTIKSEKYITIRDNDKKYIIDLSYYRQDDGVLMFKPGKSPIYWTMRKEEENCFEYYGFPEWYFNCR